MWGLGSWGLSLGLGLGLRLGFLPPEEVEVLSKVRGALARHLARVRVRGRAWVRARARVSLRKVRGVLARYREARAALRDPAQRHLGCLVFSWVSNALTHCVGSDE